MLATACGTDIGTATDEGQPTPVPTPVDVADISLVPAPDSGTPEEVPSAAAVPSAEVPSGEPSSFIPPSEYVLGADDLAAFISAYEELFPDSGLDESGFNAVGSHLCTYLMRHADAGGEVDLGSALTEADINEPGYTRDDWLTAFETANAYYCGEFTVDFSSIGG